MFETAFYLLKNDFGKTDEWCCELFGNHFKFEFNYNFTVKFHLGSMFSNFLDRIFLDGDLFAIDFKTLFFQRFGNLNVVDGSKNLAGCTGFCTNNNGNVFQNLSLFQSFFFQFCLFVSTLFKVL